MHSLRPRYSIFTIPNRGEGYTTDDNARALIFAVLLEQLGKEQLVKADSAIRGFATRDSAFRYLAFLEHAFDPAKGRFKNFLGYDRRWNEAEGSEDCHGRNGRLNGLGREIRSGLKCAAGRLPSPPPSFRAPVPGIPCSDSEYLDAYPGDRDAQRVKVSTGTACSNSMQFVVPIGNGLRMYSHMETRDYPKPCYSWVPRAPMTA
jgi:hypothetical protein